MPSARDVMTPSPVVVRSDASITEAIRVLLGRDISGVPVVDGEGALVGILSERDCLRVLAIGAYSGADHERLRSVAEFMTPAEHTVAPETGLYSLADFFLTHHQRRLPVLEGGRLVGLVSRRDVLRGIHAMVTRRPGGRGEARAPKLYPSATEASPKELGERLR